MLMQNLTDSLSLSMIDCHKMIMLMDAISLETTAFACICFSFNGQHIIFPLAIYWFPYSSKMNGGAVLKLMK